MVAAIDGSIRAGPADGARVRFRKKRYRVAAEGARVRFRQKRYGDPTPKQEGSVGHIHLRETDDGWVVESADGGGLAVPRLSEAITIADAWILATGGSRVVVTRADGSTEEYGETSDMAAEDGDGGD